MCLSPTGPGFLFFFSQVGWHFGIYELFDDGMGSYSECIVGQLVHQENVLTFSSLD